MRIVLLNQFFCPDTVATAQLLCDVAEALGQDNEVIAICSSSTEREVNSNPGFGSNVTILRTWGFKFGHRGLSRIASYISYIAGTLWHGIRGQGADVYLTLTTPPILSAIGSGLAFLRGAHHLIWEMDVYPDIASDI